MLLDILSEDEVKTIFFDYLAELYKEEDIGIAIDEDPSNEEYDQEEDAIISSQIQQLRDVNAIDLDSEDNLQIDTGANVVIGQRDAGDTIDAALVGRIEGPPEKVEYGCTVLLEKIDGKSKTTYEYRIPRDKDQAKKENVWYGIYDSMLGHIVGYEFFCGGNFKIAKIMW
jgi:transcription elongation GreA/GreB family factor